jgi:hypothetical protein
MTRIASRPPARPIADRTPAVNADIRKQLKGTFEKLVKAGNLEFGKAPKGDSFARVPLKAGKGDQYGYTALIPTGGKSKDPNKADGFLLERSGGLAGRKEVAGPFTFEGKKLGKPAPFFEKFLEGQKPGGAVTTKRFPSDNEAVDPGKPTAPVQTKRYPSDDESVDPSKPKPPGGTMQTMRYPSDNESVDTNSGGTVQTMRFPSDNESVDTKPGKPGGTVQTMRYPSDNESIDTKPGTKPGKPDGMVQTMRFPSDNEDGTVR